MILPESAICTGVFQAINTILTQTRIRTFNQPLLFSTTAKRLLIKQVIISQFLRSFNDTKFYGYFYGVLKVLLNDRFISFLQSFAFILLVSSLNLSIVRDKHTYLFI